MFRYFLIGLTLIATSSQLLAQNQLREPILLRDLSLLKNRSIVSFDVDTILLDDLSNLSWDEIASANHPDKKFHQLQAQLSLPLYRLKKRLKSKDYLAALPLARKLEPVVKESRGANYQLSMFSQMAGHLEQSQRPQAAIAWFQLMECENVSKTLAPFLTGTQFELDDEIGLCENLVPLFFDREACKKALDVLELKTYDQEKKRKQGLSIYAVALCVGAGELELAEAYYAEIDDALLHSDWERTMGVQIAMARQKSIELNPRRISPKNQDSAKVAFQFAIGSSRIEEEAKVEQERGIVELLTIPAVYGEKFPEISAAALDTVRRWAVANDHQERQRIIQNEMLQNYSATYFGNKLKLTLKSK